MNKKPETYPLLNIEIDNWQFNDFLESLTEGVVVTPNSDHMVKLQKDREFYECYLAADHVVCDSRVLLLLSKILTPSKPIKAQIAGSDIFPAFCEHHKDNQNMKVFLLGGTEESVVTAAENINSRTNSQIIVGGYSPPFGFEKSEEEKNKIFELVRASGANVLAVGVGAPKQEKWIHQHRKELDSIKLYFAIGATIEFEAGGLSRAPKWMTKAGIEWVYRLAQEPKRMFKRYILEDTLVLALIIKQRLGLYSDPWQDK